MTDDSRHRPSAAEILQKLRDCRKADPGHWPPIGEVDDELIDERERLISERRDAILTVAPEILVERIESKPGSFWSNPRFEEFGWRGLDAIIEDELCNYALETDCYLIGSSTSLEILEGGTVWVGDGTGGACWYSTPRQRRRLQSRLEEVVGRGNFRIYENGGRVSIGVEDTDIEIAVAVPLTYAAAEAMRKLRLAGEFLGQ